MIFSKNINKTDLPCVWCCVCFCLCAFGAILKRFRRLLIFHVDSPLREKERSVAFWVNGHDGSRSKLDKFHKNAPIAPKLPSADLPMIQLSVCYFESSKIYLHRSENARFPTDALLLFLSSDALSSALRHMIDRRLEFQLNGRSMATWRTRHRDNSPFSGNGHGILHTQRWGEPCVEFDRKWRENSLTNRVEIELLRANCLRHHHQGHQRSSRSKEENLQDRSYFNSNIIGQCLKSYS